MQLLVFGFVIEDQVISVSPTVLSSKTVNIIIMAYISKTSVTVHGIHMHGAQSPFTLELSLLGISSGRTMPGLGHLSLMVALGQGGLLTTVANERWQA